MKNIKYILSTVLSLALVLSGAVLVNAQQAEGAKGVHEPGTGLENPALKAENQGTGLGMGIASSTTGTTLMEQHRNAIANFAQSLNGVANRAGGIGQQIRLMAQEQNQSASNTIQAMEKVQTRSAFRTFLLGTDYKNIGALRSEMVQTENRIERLNELMTNIENTADKTELQNQIQTLIAEKTKIEEFVKTQEGKVNLFGWLTRMFSK
jgi:hypothetical protein